MMTVRYELAVEKMTAALLPYLSKDKAAQLAGIVAMNSADGVHSHGMNRFARMVDDMKTGLCCSEITEAEKISGFGGLERWDAHFGVGPLIAEQCTARVIELAKEHGIGCIGLANNSHWLRPGRYGMEIAEAGMVGLCFTNTTMNLTAYGTQEASTGNNPIVMALPRREGILLMDMAVSQYAYGKLEIMAQEGKMLPTPCGFDSEGRETCDPAEIIRTGKMFPMALWKGSALSMALDMMATMLSNGRTSRMIGVPGDGERGLSMVFIAIHPEALGAIDEVKEKIEQTAAFLRSLPTDNGQPIRLPGENAYSIRRKSLEEGVPVVEETWNKICRLAEEASE